MLLHDAAVAPATDDAAAMVSGEILGLGLICKLQMSVKKCQQQRVQSVQQQQHAVWSDGDVQSVIHCTLLSVIVEKHCNHRRNYFLMQPLSTETNLLLLLH